MPNAKSNLAAILVVIFAGMQSLKGQGYDISKYNKKFRFMDMGPTFNYSNSFRPSASTFGIGYSLILYGPNIKRIWMFDVCANINRKRFEPSFLINIIRYTKMVSDETIPYSIIDFGGQYKTVFEQGIRPRYLLGPTIRIETGVFGIQYFFGLNLSPEKILNQPHEIRILLRPLELYRSKR